jgi:hypothetical protein
MCLLCTIMKPNWCTAFTTAAAAAAAQERKTGMTGYPLIDSCTLAILLLLPLLLLLVLLLLRHGRWA